MAIRMSTTFQQAPMRVQDEIQDAVLSRGGSSDLARVVLAVNERARNAEDTNRALRATIEQLRAELAGVRKDAERLNGLEMLGEAYGFQDIYEGNRWTVEGPFSNIRAAIDAALTPPPEKPRGTPPADHASAGTSAPHSHSMRIRHENNHHRSRRR